MNRLHVRIFAEHPSFIPYYATPGAAAADVMAGKTVTIPRNCCALVPLGFFLETPEGWCAKLYIRSSLGKRGITLANSVGIIDSDYRGEVCALVQNNSTHDITIFSGDRIAQLMFEPVTHASFLSMDAPELLTETKRGTGGFGSTGT